jgi:nucleoid-associated protein YgaU
VAPRRTPPPPDTVVVRRGDCLWSIARHDLPRGATSAEVTARWRAVYAVNRPVIGPDPDVIEPGQRLRLPRKDPA